MPGGVTLNFNDMLRMIDSAPDKSIIVRDGSFQSVGKIGAFFAAKANCRQASYEFLEGVRQKYGDTVANTLEPELRVLRESGKALSSRTARDLLGKAEDLSAGLKRVNEDMARKFISGSGLRGDTRNLDAAFAEFCSRRELDPNANQELRETFDDLKQAFGEIVRRMALNSDHVLSFAEMSKAVSDGEMLEMKNAMEVVGFVRSGTKTGILRELSEEHGLNAAQRADLEKVADMALRFTAEQSKTPVNAESLGAGLKDNIAVQSFLYCCGASTLQRESTLRDVLDMASATPHRDDTISLASHFGNGYISNFMLALQKMPAMRALQPSGMLTRDTIWQACFNEPLPSRACSMSVNDFNNAVFDKIQGMFERAAGGDAVKATEGVTVLSTGITLEKSMASMGGPVSLTMNDFIAPPTLTPLQRLGSLEAVEKELAKDLHRRGSHQALAGYDPVITFGREGQAVETVHIQDTSGLSEEQKQAFADSNISPISNALVAKARELCGENEVQLRQMVLSMGQVSTLLLRSDSSVTGIVRDEHSPVDLDVRREANGNVTMRFHTPANSPLDADYTYTISPDGRGVLTACRMQARQPAGA